MWIVGGDHWLTDESRNGRILRGVNLTVTQNGLPVGLHLPLMQPLIMDRDMDQLVTLEWHIPETPGGNHLPTSIRRCYMDCTQSGSAQGLKAEEQYVDAQDLPTHDGFVTGPWPSAGMPGCTRACSNTYEMEEPQRIVKSPGSCVPRLDKVCPASFEPVCGEDGQTYKNQCSAEARCIRVQHDGICDYL